MLHARQLHARLITSSQPSLPTVAEDVDGHAPGGRLCRPHRGGHREGRLWSALLGLCALALVCLCLFTAFAEPPTSLAAQAGGQVGGQHQAGWGRRLAALAARLHPQRLPWASWKVGSNVPYGLLKDANNLPDDRIVLLTHAPDQQLYREERNALPRRDFEALRQGVLASPLRKRANTLDATNFGKSSGWVIFFNKEGAEILCSTSPFKAVCPFFNKVRLPKANAWAMNLLDSEPVAQDADMSAPTAGEHQDDTLPDVLPSGSVGISHETDVLYVQVPKDMIGGKLELWGVEPFKKRMAAMQAALAAVHAEKAAALERAARAKADIAAAGGDDEVLRRAQHESMQSQARAQQLEVEEAGVDGSGSEGDDDGDEGPDVVVIPEENKILRFRGDAIHRVLKHKSASGQERISLVIEQYIVAPKYYDAVPVWWVSGQDSDYDDLQPFWAAGDMPHLLDLPKDTVKRWRKVEYGEEEEEEGEDDGNGDDDDYEGHEQGHEAADSHGHGHGDDHGHGHEQARVPQHADGDGDGDGRASVKQPTVTV